VIFQDFPGPGIFKKRIQDFPGGVRTLSHNVCNDSKIKSVFCVHFKIQLHKTT